MVFAIKKCSLTCFGYSLCELCDFFIIIVIIIVINHGAGRHRQAERAADGGVFGAVFLFSSHGAGSR